LIILSVQAQPELAGLNSTKPRALWRLIRLVIATAVNVFEQLIDSFKSSMQQKVQLAAPGTPQWLMISPLRKLPGGLMSGVTIKSLGY